MSVISSRVLTYLFYNNILAEKIFPSKSPKQAASIFFSAPW
jgi:hypothetical protein